MGTQGVKFDRSKFEILEAIKKHNGKLTRAARELNCNYDTIRKYTDDDPEVVQLIKNLRQQYKEDMCDSAEDTLKDAIDGRNVDMTSALKSAFYVLNNLGRERGYTPQQSQEQIIVKYTPDQIQKSLDDSRQIN
jgi:hypothetical protein